MKAYVVEAWDGGRRTVGGRENPYDWYILSPGSEAYSTAADSKLSRCKGLTTEHTEITERKEIADAISPCFALLSVGSALSVVNL
jgi:hypothetical protein